MTAFHDLHRSGLLILPNAWDGGSAALMRAKGAKAIATTSAGVAWALGWPDGDALPVDRVVQVCADVVRAAQGLPVSIDFEGGYSDDPAMVAAEARRLVEAGAAGINIEDGGGAPELLAAKIAAIRAAVGRDLFINARCDVWLRGVGEPGTRVAEAARRGAIYAAAGADGLFTPGLTDAADIAAMVRATPLPLNLLAYPGLPDARTLEGLGVRRLSAGSGIVGATWGRAAALTEAFLADGRSEPLGEGALGWAEVNALMPAVE
ncbi:MULTISPECIES: isocitrate lyase/phosphoenolpyruvate mutase family protein [unclassified Brevundimonas]|uniref:isocitrate lyase/PEP mutase family protein n=1 Tax=unclassified Brevundimonas TaxID=2622653 RepID=UPI0006FC274D|nr:MULTISPECIES: isocitrate lyase/phosphoenolpyruvate mutase family protein [unclassified Brevundimonas]KQY87217.1 PEP phosphonomutase [Brevundimonas sp. Root1423]KRA26442.1 PEP phosphonomutase [Brevundimonas sp. Root608]